MLNKFIRLYNHVAIVEKQLTGQRHVVIIDGPSAIKISRLLADEDYSDALTFIPSIHYLAQIAKDCPALTQRLAGWTVLQLFKSLIHYIKNLVSPPVKNSSGGLTGLMNEQILQHFIVSNQHSIASVIVFNERNPTPAFAIYQAKQCDIKTYCIQHGAVVENYFPVNVDYYYTWTEFYSRLMENRVKGLRCINVGRLAYQIKTTDTIARNEIPLIVLQPANVSIDEADLVEHFKKIIDVCYQFYQRICIRPHPSDNIIAQIEAYIAGREYSIDRGDMATALAQHEVTLSLYSTVLYEAPLYGSLPIQYLESPFNKELMHRCELNTTNKSGLTSIFKQLTDPKEFTHQLELAKQFAEQRMQSGNIHAFYQQIIDDNLH